MAKEEPAPRRWQDVVGAWLGIGTAPGALIVGAGMVSRHGGSVPLLSFLIGFLAMFAIVWFPGVIGVRRPIGEGINVSSLAPMYFNPGMQRILSALIALGMTGWFGFNVGLGGAALSALLGLPGYVGPILIGIGVLGFSLAGIRRWNILAAFTTTIVIVLVVMITINSPSETAVLTIWPENWLAVVVDIATFVGYIAVFSVRSPDFTAGFEGRKDLVISNILLCLPITLIALAGVNLHRGVGSTDLVGILAQSGGLAIGNLLVFLAIIAPSFTILYSGAPALKDAVGLAEKHGMVLLTIIGVFLAVARFDLFLINWLGVLAALFPPIVVLLAVESHRRKKRLPSRRFSLWVWIPGALVSVIMTVMKMPLASLIGLAVSAVTTVIYLEYLKNVDGVRSHNEA